MLRNNVLVATAIVSTLALTAGCFDSTSFGNNNGWSLFDAALDDQDDDGDGFSEADGDCDDTNRFVHPDAEEVVDSIDNNCDGLVDDDLDGDGWGTIDGDCDDNDRFTHPMAPENCEDGKDNNCNGATDDDEPDFDGDGFGPCEGDCNDFNILIGPGSVEDPTDEVDNNCNGLVDEDQGGCDCAGEPGQSLEQRMAKAIGICDLAIINSLSFSGSPQGYGVFTDWGALFPRISTAAGDGLPAENCEFAILASGPTQNPTPQNGANSDLGIYSAPDPAPPAGQDGSDINDLNQFIIELTVPGNATGFSFDFIFFSVEYPEYVCSTFNDTFYALVIGDPALNNGERTNISFDAQGNEVTVNNGFFEYPPFWSLDIDGTAYETPENTFCGGDDPPCTVPNPCPQYKGSTTGWLRTTSPATPGQTIQLIFSIHDEGDNILDSAVVVDNFVWQTVPIDGPGTVK